MSISLVIFYLIGVPIIISILFYLLILLRNIVKKMPIFNSLKNNEQLGFIGRIAYVFVIWGVTCWLITVFQNGDVVKGVGAGTFIFIFIYLSEFYKEMKAAFSKKEESNFVQYFNNRFWPALIFLGTTYIVSLIIALFVKEVVDGNII